MGQRYNVMTPRPKQDGNGSWWHRVGTAFARDSDGLITIYLDSVPVPDPDKNNKIVMMLFEPKEDDAPPRGKQAASKGSVKGKQAAKGKRGKEEDLDDEIPF